MASRSARPISSKPPLARHLHAVDRAAWTAWLDANHTTAPEIFLVFYKKATRIACATYDEAVEEALCFGWIDGVKHTVDDQRYTYRFTPRRAGSAWSETNKRRIAVLEHSGKVRPAGQKAIDLARETGAWDKPARAVMPDQMPPELVAGLAKNRRARAAFDKEPPGRRRDWQRWIHQAKQAATRERRAKQAIACLAKGSPHPWLRNADKAKARSRNA